MTQLMTSFRAIHVGGDNAKMDHPRRLGVLLDFLNVETLIAGKYQ